MLVELSRLEARQVVGGQDLEFEISSKTCYKRETPKALSSTTGQVTHETCVSGKAKFKTNGKKLLEKGRDAANSVGRKALETAAWGARHSVDRP